MHRIMSLETETEGQLTILGILHRQLSTQCFALLSISWKRRMANYRSSLKYHMQLIPDRPTKFDEVNS